MLKINDSELRNSSQDRRILLQPRATDRFSVCMRDIPWLLLSVYKRTGRIRRIGNVGINSLLLMGRLKRIAFVRDE